MYGARVDSTIHMEPKCVVLIKLKYFVLMYVCIVYVCDVSNLQVAMCAFLYMYCTYTVITTPKGGCVTYTELHGE